MTFLWRMAIHGLRAKPARTALTGLSVVAAVSVFIGVLEAVTATQRVQRQLYESLAGKSDLVVSAKDGGRFREETLEIVRRTAGIRIASPTLEQFTVMRSGGDRIRLLAIGLESQSDREFRDFEIEAGRSLAGAGEVLVEASFARRVGIGPGAEISLLTPTWMRKLTVVGLVAGSGVANATRGGGVYLALPELQRLFLAKGQIDSIQCILDDGLSPEEVANRLERVLPRSLAARLPTARTRLAETTKQATNFFLIVSGGLAILSAGFVLFKIWYMAVAERKRHFAALRLIGATPNQLTRILLCEAILVSVAGTSLGLPLGRLIGLALGRTVEQLLEVTPDERSAWWPLIAGALFGPVLALTAALLPALRARAIDPLLARPASGVRSEQAVRPSHARAGSAMIVLAALGSWLSAEGYVPPVGFIPSILLGLAGFVWAIPALLTPMSVVMAVPLRAVLGYQGDLARQQVLRTRLRTSLTVGVLFIAVSTGIGISNTGEIVIRGIGNWFDRSYPATFFLRAMMPDLNGETTTSLDEGFETQLMRMPGLERLDRLAWKRAQVEDEPAMLMARDFDRYDYLPLSLDAGDESLIRGRLLAGEAILCAPLARRIGRSVGDTIDVTIGERSQRLTVAGIANEYTFGGLAILVHRPFAKAVFGVSNVDVFLIYTTPRKVAEAQLWLEALASEHGLLCQSFAELRQHILGMAEMFDVRLRALALLAITIGAFGIANALAMNILEQTRELGLLRIIGLDRAGLRRMVVGQAALIGLLGIVPGGVAGLLVAHAIHLGADIMFGNPTPGQLHPVPIAVCLIATAALVAASALIPAIRVSRLDPLTALRS